MVGLTKERAIELFNKKIGFDIKDLMDFFTFIVDEYEKVCVSVYGTINENKYGLLIDIVNDKVQITSFMTSEENISKLTNIFFSVYVPSPKEKDLILDVMERLKFKFEVYGYVYHHNFYSEFKFAPKVMYK